MIPYGDTNQPDRRAVPTSHRRSSGLRRRSTRPGLRPPAHKRRRAAPALRGDARTEPGKQGKGDGARGRGAAGATSHETRTSVNSLRAPFMLPSLRTRGRDSRGAQCSLKQTLKIGPKDYGRWGSAGRFIEVAGPCSVPRLFDPALRRRASIEEGSRRSTSVVDDRHQSGVDGTAS